MQEAAEGLSQRVKHGVTVICPWGSSGAAAKTAGSDQVGLEFSPYINLSLAFFIYLSIYLSIYPSIYPSIPLSIPLSILLPLSLPSNQSVPIVSF